MGKKKKIALVSITINAVNPMTNFLKKNAPEYDVVNYLDGDLLAKVNREGKKISDECMERMLRMITLACQDGADAVIMTCTIFSVYQPYFEKIFSVPIYCADGAMLDAATSANVKTAVICTFEGTVDTTRSMYYSYCRKNGVPEEVDMYAVPDAFAAAQAGDMDTCNQIIQAKVRELDEKYDQIVLAQISMCGAAEGLEMKHAKLYTSPSCTLDVLRENWK